MKIMSRTNETIQEAEERIPQLAKSATRSAYRKVLASGNTVLVAENGEIRRVHPDGSTEFVKKSFPAVKMRKGTIIKIK